MIGQRVIVRQTLTGDSLEKASALLGGDVSLLLLLIVRIGTQTQGSSGRWWCWITVSINQSIESIHCLSVLIRPYQSSDKAGTQIPVWQRLDARPKLDGKCFSQAIHNVHMRRRQHRPSCPSPWDSSLVFGSISQAEVVMDCHFSRMQGYIVRVQFLYKAEIQCTCAVSVECKPTR